MTNERESREPSEGERNAISGIEAQTRLAASVLLTHMPNLEWIRVADPAAGILDDFQFKVGGAHHAVQVKHSQYPGSFTWSDLTGWVGKEPPLIRRIAAGWSGLQHHIGGKLVAHLRTNDTPSVSSPPARSPLGLCDVDGPKHLGAFIARSLEPVQEHIRISGSIEWEALLDLPEASGWRPAWEALRIATDAGDEFCDFLAAVSIEFGPLPNTSMFGDFGQQLTDDVRRLSGVLRELVADPTRPVQVGRDELLARAGWSGRIAFRHDHRFPLPPMYRENREAATALHRVITSNLSGYVGVFGPAGSGKSSLLTGFHWDRARVVHYYAFVPDAPDPLSARGEAESFLSDVSLQLEHLGYARPSHPAGIVGRQAVLAAQLARASAAWREDQIRTVIVVDGLDHIAREQNPTRSLLDELLLPSGIPDGVLFVLGAQTPHVLPPDIRRSVDGPDRSVSIPPLGSTTTLKIIEGYEPAGWLTENQKQYVANLSEGHPLALTYLLQDVDRIGGLPDRDAALAEIQGSSATSSDPLAARYEGYLAGIDDDAGVLDLLSVVARLRIAVDLEWLSTWAAPDSINAFVDQAASFFWRTGSTWRFVHNSFRLFLVAKTAQVAGAFDTNLDRTQHQRVAALCRDSVDERWTTYRREEIAHCLLAGDHQRVLELARPDELRAATVALRPTRTVREHAGFGLRAAAAAADHAAYFDLLLFMAELSDSANAIEPTALAKSVVGVLDAPQTLEHFVVGRTPQIGLGEVVAAALRLANLGQPDAARALLDSVGGLRQLLTDRGHERKSAILDEVADWTRSHAFVFGIETTWREVELLVPLQGFDDAGKQLTDRDRKRIEIAVTAAIALHEVAAQFADEAWINRLTALITNFGKPSDRLEAILARVRICAEDGDEATAGEMAVAAAEVARIGDEHESRTLGMYIAYLLLGAGFETPGILLDLIPAQPPKVEDTFDYDRGVDQFGELIVYLQLRGFLNRQLTPATVATSAIGRLDAPVKSRLVSAVVALANLGADRLRIAQGEKLSATIDYDPIIRLTEVPSTVTRDWNTWGRLSANAAALQRRLVALVLDAADPPAQERLLRAFEDAWTHADRSRYWSASRRLEILDEVMSRTGAFDEWANRNLRVIRQMMTDGGGSEDIGSWFQAAEVLGRAGDLRSAAMALESAVARSYQLSQYADDDQLRGWLLWLLEATRNGDLARDSAAEDARDLANRLTWAHNRFGAYVDESTQALVEIAWLIDPGLAADLGEELCDLGVIKEERLIAAMAQAAVRHGAEVSTVTQVVCQMLLPVYRGVPRELPIDLAAALCGDSNLEEELTAAIDVWSLPEEAAEWHAAIENATEGPTNRPNPPNAESALSVLRGLRRSSIGNQDDWATRIGAIERANVSEASAILAECYRLDLGALALCTTAGLLAAAGDHATAVSVVNETVSRLSAWSWLSEFDEPGRLLCWEAAVARGSLPLVAAGLEDLASCLTDPESSIGVRPAPLRRAAVALIRGISPTTQWQRVREHVRRLVPDGPPAEVTTAPRVVQPQLQRDSTGCLLGWVSGYVAHPAIVLDYGARKVLTNAIADPSTTDVALQWVRVLLDEGGARAEAAATLCSSPVDVKLNPSFEGMASSRDGILRLSALKLGFPLRVVPRSLPAGYSMVFPDLLERRPWVTDKSGLPQLDTHDPRDLTAPFDKLIAGLAELVSIDETSALYQAARYASSCRDAWIDGGYPALHARLMSRDSKHTFRPWAWMAGRRALGHVIADLIDAGLLEPQVAKDAALIDQTLTAIETLPLDSSTPTCYRVDDPSYYTDKNWLQDCDAAAVAYAGALRPEYILAEVGKWRSLDWGRPSEERQIEASGEGQGTLQGVSILPRVRSYSPPGEYPHISRNAAEAAAFAVEGYFGEADQPHYEWLAIHPGLAAAAGWTPTHAADFSWSGDDGVWRARSVVRARGNIERPAPVLRNCVGLVWQVEISAVGVAELQRIARTTRRVVVSRTLKENNRQGRAAAEAKAHAPII